MKKYTVVVDEDLQDLIPDYINRQKSEISSIQDHLNKNDFPSIGRLAHDWQGTGAGYGVPFISKIGKKLGIAVKEEKEDVILDLANQLETYLEQLEIIYE